MLVNHKKESDMFSISVIFDIDPDHAEEFKAASLRHAHNSKTNESGCLGFEIFVNTDSPNKFYFHETYVNKAAVDDVHSKAPYLAEFGKLTAGWIRSRQIDTWNSAE